MVSDAWVKDEREEKKEEESRTGEGRRKTGWVSSQIGKRLDCQDIT